MAAPRLAPRLKVAILYDADEDRIKAETEARGVPFLLVREEVATVIQGLGHEVRLLPADMDICGLVRRLREDDSDLVMNLCESLSGVSQFEQDAAMLLEVAGRRFTGSGSMGLALAQDKELTKKLLHFHSIPSPRYAVVENGRVGWADELSFPLFVKPLNQDASIGIGQDAVVRSVRELLTRVSAVQAELVVPALVEEYVEGRELYVSVLGNDPPRALPVVEWDFSTLPEGVERIASSEAKWDDDSVFKGSRELFPEDIPAAVLARMQEAAVTAFKALRLRDYGRVDLRLRQGAALSDDGWEFFVIEVNPNPHLSAKGELAMAAARDGLPYPDLIDRIITLALERTGLGHACPAIRSA